MDFWKNVLVLVKRRTVIIPVLAAAALAAGLAFVVAPTTYTTSSVGIFTTQSSGASVSPGGDRTPVLTNPLINLDSGLKTAVILIIQSVTTPEELEAMGAGGPNATTVTITDGTSDVRFVASNGPFIIFAAQSRSASEARDVVLRAEQRVRKELVSRQQSLNAPMSTYVDLVEVVPVSAPEPQTFNKVRVAASVFVLILLLGIGAAYGLQRYKHRRRPVNPAAGDAEQAPETPADEPSAHTPPRTNGVAIVDPDLRKQVEPATIDAHSAQRPGIVENSPTRTADGTTVDTATVQFPAIIPSPVDQPPPGNSGRPDDEGSLSMVDSPTVAMAVTPSAAKTPEVAGQRADETGPSPARGSSGAESDNVPAPRRRRLLQRSLRSSPRSDRPDPDPAQPDEAKL